MKRSSIILFSIFIFLGLGIIMVSAQDTVAILEPQVKTTDINKDGTADITYYSDGKYITKIQADTNYDGTPDIVMHTKDGKFDSAEIDTNYDGKFDKKITNADEFKNWINKNDPSFEEHLTQRDWDATLFRF